ncbi:MAG: hypothetical protein QNL33_05160 [Akkermansiaceae bacterium]
MNRRHSLALTGGTLFSGLLGAQESGEGIAEEFLRTHDIPGLSFAIAKEGRVNPLVSFLHRPKQAGEPVRA